MYKNDKRPLTPETAREVDEYLDSQGYFESIMKKAYPKKQSSHSISASFKKDLERFIASHELKKS